MKAMLTALAAVVVIGAIASVTLNSLGFSSAETYSSANTRLD